MDEVYGKSDLYSYDRLYKLLSDELRSKNYYVMGGKIVRECFKSGRVRLENG